MSRELWSGEGPVLADTSAWIVARRIPTARELLLAGVERGEIAWCWPVRYELMIDARGADGIAVVDRTLEGLREIAVDRAVQRGVLAAMRDLAATPASRSASSAARRPHRRGSRPAIGHRLHHDEHFDRLATLLSIRSLWIADPSQ